MILETLELLLTMSETMLAMLQVWEQTYLNHLLVLLLLQ